MRAKWLVLLVAVFAATALSGCGSNGGSGGDSTTGDPGLGSEGGIAFVGSATCIECHADLSFSAENVEKFLAGPHVIHSDHISAEDEADGCLECHDPIGDGPGLEPLIDAANVPDGGLAAVGCENCHGAGGDHFGVGPIPDPVPDYTACGQCHKTLPGSHVIYHPEGNDIITKYEGSRHATASVRNEVICAKCHTDEGGRLYKYVQTREGVETLVFPVEGEGSPVQCRTCHDPHNPNELLLGEMEIEFKGDEIDVSAEYATCTTCHMRDWIPVAELPYHDDRHMRVITDSHYDDPDTADVVEGYVIDRFGERPCRTCHDVHDVQEIRIDARPGREDSMTIHDQWAESGHAGHLRLAKIAEAEAQEALGFDRTAQQTEAIKETGIDGEAFIHDSGTNGWDNTVEDASCQRCHTATGGMNFLQDPAAYEAALAAYDLSGDPADAPNDYSYLEGWTAATGSGQTELIYCWVCHSDNNGGFNDPGSIPFPSGASQSLADGSNTCMACHQGRESGLSIVGATPNAIVQAPDYDSFDFINRHYYAAAAIQFGTDVTAGFEYAGRSYDGQSDFADHPDTLQTCRGCHLREGSADHTFEPDIERCDDCHIGVADFNDMDRASAGGTDVDYDGDTTVESFQEEIDGFAGDGIVDADPVPKGSLLIGIETYASVTLVSPILYAPGSYPYWFQDNGAGGGVAGDGIANGTEVSFGNRYRDFDRNLLQAAFNFHSAQDPCGDIHNHRYVIQTLYDALDDLDDGLQNDSVIGNRPL